MEKIKLCSTTRVSIKIFINDLPDGITSRCKLFADDYFPFSKVYDIDISAKELNSDLEKISKWAFQRKMQFNPDPNKQANEVIFFRKTKNSSHPLGAFNNNDIKKYPYCKHLSSKLGFKFYVDQKIKKCNKLTGLIKRKSSGDVDVFL